MENVKSQIIECSKPAFNKHCVACHDTKQVISEELLLIGSL